MFLCLYAMASVMYLFRLEDMSGADIFLPLDYNAIVPPNQELEEFYKTYATQPGRPYTIRDDLLLSRLACVYFPEANETGGTITVRDMCDIIEREIELLGMSDAKAMKRFGMNREALISLTHDVKGDDKIMSLEIVEYIDERWTGFAGLVLRDADSLTIAFRGTDDLTDAIDNAAFLSFNVSLQYDSVKKLLAKYGGERNIWLTGHSKGGHNAIYAASIDERCKATAFNAPGFGIFLTDAQHDGLSRGVNYVINGDVTGFLLFHLERRVVLDTQYLAMTMRQKHWLINFFEVDNLSIAISIVRVCVTVEWVTQFLFLALGFMLFYLMFIIFVKLYLSTSTLAGRTQGR